MKAKNLLKLSVSLFLNQILASIGGFMCIILVWLLFKDRMAAHILFFAITFSFFYYIEYMAAFKAGFHNEDRRNKPNSKKYIFTGAFAGLISAIPALLFYIFYIVTTFTAGEGLQKVAILYYRILNMYYSWPLGNIFPNHMNAVFLTSFIPMIIIPMLGYIAGYKNFIFSDLLVKYIKK